MKLGNLTKLALSLVVLVAFATLTIAAPGNLGIKDRVSDSQATVDFHKWSMLWGGRLLGGKRNVNNERGVAGASTVDFHRFTNVWANLFGGNVKVKRSGTLCKKHDGHDEPSTSPLVTFAAAVPASPGLAAVSTITSCTTQTVFPPEIANHHTNPISDSSLAVTPSTAVSTLLVPSLTLTISTSPSSIPTSIPIDSTPGSTSISASVSTSSSVSDSLSVSSTLTIPATSTTIQPPASASSTVPSTGENSHILDIYVVLGGLIFWMFAWAVLA